MKELFIALVLGCFCLSGTFATLGVDVSTSVLPADWSCLKSAGYTYGVVRCYQSNGVTDPNCPHTIYNAWAGGMSHVDAYIFPCYSCGNPSGQVSTTYNYLKSFNCTYGQIWLDIEAPSLWSTSTTNNINFIKSMISEGEALGVHLGIYTSQSQWQPITGDWTGASNLPLWYAHYDNSASFSDFASFAGWSSPAIKQYVGDATVCGVGADLDWYPTPPPPPPPTPKPPPPPPTPKPPPAPPGSTVKATTKASPPAVTASKNHTATELLLVGSSSNIVATFSLVLAMVVVAFA